MSNGLTSVACRSLSTPRNLEVIRRKYPGLCPYHITHNILGLNFEQHGSCTARPFSDGVCVHGRHSDPALSAEARSCKGQVAVGKTLQLPLGLSRRAGSSKLVDGCVACNAESEFDTACVACGRAWTRSRRLGSRPVAADDAAYYKWCSVEIQRQGGHVDGGEDGGGGRWQEEEEWEAEGEEWYGEEEYGGEEEGYEEAEWGQEEDEPEESGSDSSSSGAEEPPAKRARDEAGPSSVSPPAQDAALRLRLEAALATVRALEAELKLAKGERDLKRLGE